MLEDLETTSFLCNLLGQGPMGFCLLDAESACTYVNPRWCEITGVSLEEAREGGWATGLHPEDRARVFEEWYRAIRAKGPFVSSFRFLRPGGEVRWVQAHGFTFGETQEGCYVGMITDVTEARREDELLRGRNQVLEKLVGSATTKEVLATLACVLEGCSSGLICAVFHKDPSADTMLLAAAPSLDRSLKERVREVPLRIEDGRVARTLARVLHGERLFIEDVLAGREWERFHGLAREAGIRTIWIEPVFGTMGEVIGAVALFYATPRKPDPAELESIQSITNLAGFAIERRSEELGRRALEKRSQQQQRLESLSTLAGGIAHDFNNLLVAILGNASLARDQLPVDSALHTNMAQIELASERATRLTKRLLEFAGKSRPHRQALDLTALLTTMEDELVGVLREEVRLELDLAVGLKPIEADPEQIRRIVKNLVANAMEAIGEEAGTIVLATGIQEVTLQEADHEYVGSSPPQGQFLYMEVRDGGCGMDEESRSRMFDPFYTTKLSGRGLGLASVLGMVRGHGGNVKVESELGVGTTLRVLFPTEEPVARGKESPSKGTAVAREATTLLVVDDDEGVRIVARRVLESQSYRVLTAVDGVDGIRVFEQHAEEIGAVVLDLTMPNKGGVETFRELRRIRPDVKVLLSSGYAREDTELLRLSQEGLAGFIQKPYRPKDLIDQLEAVLACP